MLLQRILFPAHYTERALQLKRAIAQLYRGSLMKSSSTLLVATLLLVVPAAYSQEIPKGVNYKRAPEAVNALAKANLEAALLGSDSLPADLFGEGVVIGPLLWKALKPTADKVLLDAKPAIIMVQVPVAVAAEAKRILTDDERKSFLKLLRSKYSKLKESKVRKGTAEEISYYWATIPFDIEEPFWVIETSSDRFIANFQVTSGQPRLFWIDLVDDLQKLRP